MKELLDINKLEKWGNYKDLEFDYIYISQTNLYNDNYILGVFIGVIGEEIKIIDYYDCGNNLSVGEEIKITPIQFDFENPYGGIKVWNARGNKIMYRYGGILSG